jgi:hypothetical protein
MAIPEKKNVTDLGQQAIALAEQLGRIAGTIEGTAEAWLNRGSLVEQLVRVRDGAAQMLETLADGAARGRQAATETARSMGAEMRQAAGQATSTASSMAAAAVESARRARSSVVGAPKKKASRAGGSPRKATAADKAHAPGKRHRKPAPTVHGAKKSDQKIAKMRGAAAVRQRRKSYA